MTSSQTARVQQETYAPESTAPSSDVLETALLLQPTGEEAGSGLLAGFQQVKHQLTSNTGVSYKEFKKTLSPRYGLVWAQLLSGHLALIVIAIALSLLQRRVPQAWPLTVVAGALGFGWFLHYVLEFFHEAMHFNLARDRRVNDWLTSIFICSLLGVDLRSYRALHFDHHRYLGTPRDPESSYFDALTFRFLLESLSGVRTVRTWLARGRTAQEKLPDVGMGTALRRMLYTVAVNLVVLVILFWSGGWPVALAWVVAAGTCCPTFHLVRQLLEHRDPKARVDVDYSKVPHGALSRLFGDGPISSTFGAAGFNRHLLHHLEPQVPCTRLGALDRFLRTTAIAPELASHQTSYGRTFLELLQS